MDWFKEFAVNVITAILFFAWMAVYVMALGIAALPMLMVMHLGMSPRCLWLLVATVPVGVGLAMSWTNYLKQL